MRVQRPTTRANNASVNWRVSAQQPLRCQVHHVPLVFTSSFDTVQILLNFVLTKFSLPETFCCNLGSKSTSSTDESSIFYSFTSLQQPVARLSSPLTTLVRIWIPPCRQLLLPQERSTQLVKGKSKPRLVQLVVGIFEPCLLGNTGIVGQRLSTDGKLDYYSSKSLWIKCSSSLRYVFQSLIEILELLGADCARINHKQQKVVYFCEHSPKTLQIQIFTDPLCVKGTSHPQVTLVPLPIPTL
jgi:hypothetical protein